MGILFKLESTDWFFFFVDNFFLLLVIVVGIPILIHLCRFQKKHLCFVIHIFASIIISFCLINKLYNNLLICGLVSEDVACSEYAFEKIQLSWSSKKVKNEILYFNNRISNNLSIGHNIIYYLCFILRTKEETNLEEISKELKDFSIGHNIVYYLCLILRTKGETNLEEVSKELKEISPQFFQKTKYNSNRLNFSSKDVTTWNIDPQ